MGEAWGVGAWQWRFLGHVSGELLLDPYIFFKHMGTLVAEPRLTSVLELFPSNERLRGQT